MVIQAELGPYEFGLVSLPSLKEPSLNELSQRAELTNLVNFHELLEKQLVGVG